MKPKDLTSRVVELEARAAFQEDTITRLDDVVTDQRDQIDRLERMIEALRTRVMSLAGTTDAGVDADVGQDPWERDRPPHY